MKLEVKKHLFDIQQACERIMHFTAGKRFEDYFGNVMLRSAVERQFEIVGEAMTRLRRDGVDPETLIPDARQIIAFRNILVHGYDAIKHDAVWDVIHNHLPALKAQVDQLLSEGE